MHKDQASSPDNPPPPIDDGSPPNPLPPIDDGSSQRLHNGPQRRASEQSQAIAPTDRGFEAYRFLAASVVFEATIWGGAYSYGAFEDYHEHNPASKLHGKSSSTATTAIGTLIIAGLHFVPLLTRGLLRTFPHLVKRMVAGSIILSSSSLLIASFFESNITVLLVFQGILYGILSGATFTPVVSWLPQWFSHRRGFASGVIYSGSGLGGTVFPLIYGKLLASVGFPWTLRIIAAFNCIVCGLAAWQIRPRLPVTRPHSMPSGKPLFKALAPRGLKGMIGPLACAEQAVIICQSSAWCTISLYIASYTSSLGFASSTSTATLAAFNASATLGYLLLGRLIDSCPYTIIMAVSTLTSSLAALFLLGFSHSLPLLIIFVLVFGTSGGGFTTFLTPIANDLALVNNQETASMYVILIAVRGVAAVGGPLIGSSLYDEDQTDFSLYGTKGFRGLVLFVGIGMLLGTFFSALSRWLRRSALDPTASQFAE